jgi:pSer/pThr/pTyr-binding forkhead associated (FHA) protein
VARFRFKIGSKTVLLPDGQHDVGRLAECWLVLDDDLVSRNHARFHVGADLTELEDLGSRNGTFVNGDKVVGRRVLVDGDRVRIGREVIEVLGLGSSLLGDEDDLRRTLAPGEDTRFPSMIGQLVEKSIKSGKVKEAERYAMALSSQLMAARVAVTHPAAEACNRCMIQLADKTASGQWIDRLFRLYAQQAWLMAPETIEQVRGALDRIPRVPGTGLRDYEQALRMIAREGAPVPPELVTAIAELADAFGAG